MNDKRKYHNKLYEAFPHLLPIVSGTALWIIIPIATNVTTAWNSSAYYYIGMPLLTIECFLLGFFISAYHWVWGIEIILSQAAVMIVKYPTSNLLPPALIFLVILSCPYFFASYVGAVLRKRATARKELEKNK